MNSHSADTYPSECPQKELDQEVVSDFDYPDVNSDTFSSMLDKLHHTNHEEWRRVCKEIESLQPEEILARFGEDALIWSARNVLEKGAWEEVGADEIKVIDAHIAQRMADSDLFRKAYAWAVQNGYSTQYDDLLRHYNATEKLHNGILDLIDLSALVKQSGRKNESTGQKAIEITDKRANDYGLIPMRTTTTWCYSEGWSKGFSLYQGQQSGIEYDIWLDSPNGFALTYKGTLNAVVGISVAENDELMVSQIQGAKAYRPSKEKKDRERLHARGLMPLDWQKLMINISEELARQLNLKSMGIQSAENNQWIKTALKDGERDVHLSKDAARRAYDEPAKRFGYVLGEDGNWHKPLV